VTARWRTTYSELDAQRERVAPRHERGYKPPMRAALLASLLMLPLAAPANDPFRVVGVEEVSNLLGKPGVHVFDANPPDVFAKGHLPGARWISYRDYPLSALPRDRAATLVFYCKNPHWMASHRAARRAVEMGYSHVLVMRDGIDGWVGSGKPVER
jgi:rhodanese-related sulfurtransferase